MYKQIKFAHYCYSAVGVLNKEIEANHSSKNLYFSSLPISTNMIHFIDNSQIHGSHRENGVDIYLIHLLHTPLYFFNMKMNR